MRGPVWFNLIVLGATGALLCSFPLLAQDAETDLTVQSEVMDSFSDDVPLFLKVFINDRDVGLVAAFNVQSGSGRMSSARAELIDIGMRVPFASGRNVYLDELDGVTFRYDELGQAIFITAGDSALQPKVISASPERDMPKAQGSYGAVLNYAIAGETGDASGSSYDSASAALDGWIFTPIGTLGTSGFYNHNSFVGNGAGFVRQESRFEATAARAAITFAVGDVISSSLPWSRPIRLGGVQLRRDFSLRSDLVTNQLLSFSGTSAVPTTVDVFIDNNRAYSTAVDSGPFTLEDVPIYGGAGEAEILIRDDFGRTRRQRVSFFTSQNLLKKGIADYSIEAGYAREAYGIESNGYGGDAVFSSSLRYGLTKTVTIEAHAEAKSGLVMGGIGLTAVPFALGEVSLTAGASRYNGIGAGFVRAGVRTEIRGVDISISSMRTEDGFADLAYATGVDYLGAGQIGTAAPLLEVPSALDILTLSIPVTKDDRRLGLALIRSERVTNEDLIASASFSTSLNRGNGAISLFGSHNFVTDDSRMSLNLSVALGKRTQARTTLASRGHGKNQAGIYVSRPISDKVGDYGYGIQVEQQETLSIAALRGEYRGRLGRVGAEVQTTNGGNRLRAEVEGALVFSGGGFGMGNAIQDSFALVEVGIADVPVYLQNREVTRTGPGGRALVPGLSAYRNNRLSLNIDDLPAGTAPGVSAKDVVPTRRAGAYVDFQSQSGPSETIVLRGPAGAELPAGSIVTLNGSRTDQYVGYDGLTWLEGVRPTNTLTVVSDAGRCKASFAGTPGGDASTTEYKTVVCK